MVMVSGRYVKRFQDASHVVFDGNLDNPVFRGIVIQRIVAIVGTARIRLADSGEVAIRTSDSGEYCTVTYRDMFGNHRATGRPFKDNDTCVATLRCDSAGRKRGGKERTCDRANTMRA